MMSWFERIKRNGFTPATLTAAKNRSVQLDVLRGVAILLVLGRHAPVCQLWTNIGWAGVDLFFVLSGFLISGLLFSEYKEHGSIHVARFYARRGLKIYPAFYALLAFAVLAQIFHPGLTAHSVNAVSLGVEALFVQNFLLGIFGYTWSLAVEEHFYLFLPIALRSTIRRSARPFASIPPVFLSIALADLVLRSVIEFVGNSKYIYSVQTPFRIDSLLFGVLLRYLREFRPEIFKRFANSRRAMVFAIGSIVWVVFVPMETYLMRSVGFTVMYLGFGWIMSRAVSSDHRAWRAWPALLIGGVGFYSYSIYLWHGPAIRITTLWLQGQSRLDSILCILIALGVGIGAAKIIEMPVLAVRDRFFPSRSTVSPRLTGAP